MTSRSKEGLQLLPAAGSLVWLQEPATRHSKTFRASGLSSSIWKWRSEVVWQDGLVRRRTKNEEVLKPLGAATPGFQRLPSTKLAEQLSAWVTQGG